MVSKPFSGEMQRSISRDSLREKIYRILIHERFCMPHIPRSSFQPPFYLRNTHLQTVYPNIFRRVKGVSYRRSRIETPDNDFIDLDFSFGDSDKAVVIAHGLEGCSGRPYVLGLVKALNAAGWDAVAWNFRGCSGEPNLQLRSYHSGDTGDLETVLCHVLQNCHYRHLALAGFSIGGNIILKYLGEREKTVDSVICGAVVLSVPCDLHGAAMKMAEPSNRLYMWRFLRMLHEKIRAKMDRFSGLIDDHDYRHIRTFKDFDDRYTAPLHGFKDAEDYWAGAASKPFLRRISVPTLLINALDDPFLPQTCYPYEEADKNPFFHLETPEYGGHVGFVSFKDNGRYWSEIRCIQFLQEHVDSKALSRHPD